MLLDSSKVAAGLHIGVFSSVISETKAILAEVMKPCFSHNRVLQINWVNKYLGIQG